MKKLVFISLTSLIFSSASFAATSGSLILRGIIDQILSITVSSEAIATNLDLTVATTGLKVATVNEQSNSLTGYEILISSANGGTLDHTTGGADQISYQLTYGGSTFTPTVAPQVIVDQTVAGAYNVNRDLEVSYAAVDATTVDAGTYEDTVTLTIQAN